MSAMTTPEYLISNANNHANERAISTKNKNGEWTHVNWAEFHDQTASVAKSLIALGFEEGDKLSIYSYNRIEWYNSYHAANMCNGAAVGVYHTCSPDEVEWVVGNSDSKIIFVGDNPMDGGNTEKMCSYRLHKILDSLDKLETAVVMDGVEMPEHSKCMPWTDFLKMGENIDYSEIEKRVDNIKPEDTFSLIYTSGTTGNPKGVELSHDNIDFELAEVWKLQNFERGWGYVSWLPCAHVFGQLVDCHAHIRWGLHMTVVDAPLNVIDYAKEVQPHLFIGVPRIYEKVYGNLVAKLGTKMKLLKIPIIGGIIKKKAKEAIGMSNCVYSITGAAPINPDILKLFHSLDIPLYEGYGMTETTAGATLGFKKNHKFGTVGKPFSGTELMISDSGEILFRGRHVMKGYYKNPEATAATIDSNGWLHSGDKGEIDGDGYVKITGRIKELYVSSGGKNIAPLVIEETMKSIPLVSQCMLIGDGRKYCSALFTLDVGAILRDKHGMDPAKIPKNPIEQISSLESFGKSLLEYTNSQEIHDELMEHVTELNGQFSNPEQIKKFKILPRDLDVDSGELTPTLKIRRIQIRENWASEIEEMYLDA